MLRTAGPFVQLVDAAGHFTVRGGVIVRAKSTAFHHARIDRVHWRITNEVTKLRGSHKLTNQGLHNTEKNLDRTVDTFNNTMASVNARLTGMDTSLNTLKTEMASLHIGGKVVGAALTLVGTVATVGSWLGWKLPEWAHGAGAASDAAPGVAGAGTGAAGKK